MIRYTVHDALLFLDAGDYDEFKQAHDQLRWSVGSRFELPVERASARVNLPEGATGIRSIAYTGDGGSWERDATVEQTEQGRYFESNREFEPFEALFVIVGWDPGVVERPTAWERAVSFSTANWMVLIVPVLVFAVLWLVWYARGRDPHRRAIVTRYDPPEDLAPGETGALVDHRVGGRDATAIVVDLARRGYLRIEEIERSAFMNLLTGHDYRLVRAKEVPDRRGLEGYERRVLSGLFQGARVKKITELSQVFYESLKEISELIYGRLIDAGYYKRRPDRLTPNYMTVAVFVALLPGLTVDFTDNLGISPMAVVIAGLASALVIGFFGFFMPARTVSGTRALEQILGFERYLDRMEESRAGGAKLSPELYEEYLPYAISLEVEEEWTRAFRGILRRPPDWYVPVTPRPFDAETFAERIARLTSRMTRTLESAPKNEREASFGRS